MKKSYLSLLFLFLYACNGANTGTGTIPTVGTGDRDANCAAFISSVKSSSPLSVIEILSSDENQIACQGLDNKVVINYNVTPSDPVYSDVIDTIKAYLSATSKPLRVQAQVDIKAIIHEYNPALSLLGFGLDVTQTQVALNAVKLSLKLSKVKLPDSQADSLKVLVNIKAKISDNNYLIALNNKLTAISSASITDAQKASLLVILGDANTENKISEVTIPTGNGGGVVIPPVDNNIPKFTNLVGNEDFYYGQTYTIEGTCATNYSSINIRLLVYGSHYYISSSQDCDSAKIWSIVLTVPSWTDGGLKEIRFSDSQYNNGEELSLPINMHAPYLGKLDDNLTFNQTTFTISGDCVGSTVSLESPRIGGANVPCENSRFQFTSIYLNYINYPNNSILLVSVGVDTNSLPSKSYTIHAPVIEVIPFAITSVKDPENNEISLTNGSIDFNKKYTISGTCEAGPINVSSLPNDDDMSTVCDSILHTFSSDFTLDDSDSAVLSGSQGDSINISLLSISPHGNIPKSLPLAINNPYHDLSLDSGSSNLTVSQGDVFDVTGSCKRGSTIYLKMIQQIDQVINPEVNFSTTCSSLDRYSFLSSDSSISLASYLETKNSNFKIEISASNISNRFLLKRIYVIPVVEAGFGISSDKFLLASSLGNSEIGIINYRMYNLNYNDYCGVDKSIALLGTVDTYKISAVMKSGDVYKFEALLECISNTNSITLSNIINSSATLNNVAVTSSSWIDVITNTNALDHIQVGDKTLKAPLNFAVNLNQTFFKPRADSYEFSGTCSGELDNSTKIIFTSNSEIPFIPNAANCIMGVNGGEFKITISSIQIEANLTLTAKISNKIGITSNKTFAFDNSKLNATQTSTEVSLNFMYGDFLVVRGVCNPNYSNKVTLYYYDDVGLISQEPSLSNPIDYDQWGEQTLIHTANCVNLGNGNGYFKSVSYLYNVISNAERSGVHVKVSGGLIDTVTGQSFNDSSDFNDEKTYTLSTWDGPE